MSPYSANSLLRDLIDIPKKVDAADYVLRLHEGVEQAERTLSDYVVTDAIASSIDEALGLVERTIDSRTAKGAFIHGSFGSGKSHFMAVMHLLLSGNLTARKLPNLQAVVARRGGVLGKKILAIDYHLMGANSLEDALFRGYLDTISARHPGVLHPVLHQSDGLFKDAQSIREAMGDDAFFAKLNSSAPSGWGDIAGGWDAEKFDNAVVEPVGSAERDRLAQALTADLMANYTRSGEWVDITQGLRAITTHAKDLGYDGLVLFLDELVLWLGQHLADATFIQSETSKVTKLVETGLAALPIPMISFVARQRNLKDFLGGGQVRAQQEALAQSFQWFEDRFEKIDLIASDLPKIVKQRLLNPVDADAKATLDSALARVKSDHTAWSYLMTDEAGANESDFSNVYPFSPALVETMVALSTLMQRDRTALKLMGEILAQGRDALTVSDIIPVGDLFDQVMQGSSEPLTEDMKKHFRITWEFYRDKFRPFLLQKHGLSESDAHILQRGLAFRTEDRLAKTLLIAHLVPQTTSLRNLTAARLAALNYGTVHAYVPGTEAIQVLDHIKSWVGTFPEFTIGEGIDPLIDVHLTGVDYNSVLDRVKAEDNEGNRRELIRSIIATELKLAETGGLVRERELSLVWRGSKRTVSVIFGNVRDRSDVTNESLTSVTDGWRLVIDYPYGGATNSPKDDTVRLSELRGEGAEAPTIVWIPNFLSAARMEEIGTVVLLEYALKPTQFDNNASHLPVTDREPARQALLNKRDQLRGRIVEVLREAYGVATARAENVEMQLDGYEIFSSLYPGLTLQPPVAIGMRDGIEKVLDQAWTFEHPKHPKIAAEDGEVRPTVMRDVIGLVQQAHEGGGRTDAVLKPAQGVLRRIAVPLGLGTLNENVFVASPATFTWLNDFTRWEAEAAQELSVAAIRAKLRPLGMSTVLEDGVILTWSILTEKEWIRAGVSTAAPTPGGLAGDMVLRPARLPRADQWATANDRVQQVFGLTPEPHLSTTAVRRLGSKIADHLTPLTPRTHELVKELESHAVALGIDPSAVTGRLHTARRASALVTLLGGEKDGTSRVEALAAFDLPTEAKHFGKSIASANEIVQALRSADWGTISTAESFGDPVVDAALVSLRTTAAEDELNVSLPDALKKAFDAAHAAVLDRAGKATAPTPAPTPSIDKPAGPEAPTGPDDVELILPNEVESKLKSIGDRITTALSMNPGKSVRITWHLE